MAEHHRDVIYPPPRRPVPPRTFARTYVDLWRRGPLLVHLARCRNRRFRVRRWHCRRESTAWRTRPMFAGFSVRAGWWLLSAGLFRRRRQRQDGGGS